MSDSFPESGTIPAMAGRWEAIFSARNRLSAASRAGAGLLPAPGPSLTMLIVYLIVSAVSSAGAYYREVGEVLTQQSSLTGKSLRVSGNVVQESIQYDAPSLSLSFKISDPADASKQLPIHFHGVQPDQIGREGASAIVEGKLLPNGTVEANNLLLKCPSRYEEYEQEEIKVEAVK